MAEPCWTDDVNMSHSKPSAASYIPRYLVVSLLCHVNKPRVVQNPGTAGLGGPGFLPSKCGGAPRQKKNHPRSLQGFCCMPCTRHIATVAQFAFAESLFFRLQYLQRLRECHLAMPTTKTTSTQVMQLMQDVADASAQWGVDMSLICLGTCIQAPIFREPAADFFSFSLYFPLLLSWSLYPIPLPSPGCLDPPQLDKDCVTRDLHLRANAQSPPLGRFLEELHTTQVPAVAFQLPLLA